MPAMSSDPLARRGFSRVPSSTGLHIRLRRPYLREAPAGFGLEHLAAVFMNNPGCDGWSGSQSVKDGEFCL
jgi:hypothetical protein